MVRRPPPGGRGQGAGGHQGGEPHLGHGDPAELLPPLREAGRHDRHRRDRGRRVRHHLRPAGRADPDQPGHGPPRRARPRLQDRGGQVQRGRRGHRRAPRARPADAHRHRVGGEVRAALAPAREARRAAQRAERQAALPRGRDRGPGRPARRASPSPPTWPAVASTSSSAATPSCWPSTSWRPRASTSRPRRAGPSWSAGSRPWRPAAGPRARRCASWAASTCSAASATRAGASTTSCAAGRAARATRARAASTCASTTSCSGSSPPAP